MPTSRFLSKSSLYLALLFPLVTLGCGQELPTEPTESTPPGGTQAAPSIQAPFYTGTVRVAEMPTKKNPDRDLVLDVEVMFRPDSVGPDSTAWPMTYYGFGPEDRVPINAVQIDYVFSAVYDGGEATPDELVEDATLWVTVDSLVWLEGGASRRYRIEVPKERFASLPQQKQGRPLRLRVTLGFEGGNLPSTPTEEDLLARFNYSAPEVLWVTPATGAVDIMSPLPRTDPVFKVVR